MRRDEAKGKADPMRDAQMGLAETKAMRWLLENLENLESLSLQLDALA